MVVEVGAELADLGSDPLLSGGYCATMCHASLAIEVPPETIEFEAFGATMPHQMHAEMLACIQCHREAVVGTSGREGVLGLREAHAWDPAMETHAKMRCVVCHTPVDRANNHEVLPSDQAIRSCDACHDVNAPLIAEYVDQAGPSFWVTNQVLFEEAYVPGATRNRVVDALLVGLFWLAVCGVLAHALLRALTRRNRPRMSAVAEKVKMYPAWLRVWHWSNAILFIVLAYTGLRMHFGQRRGPIIFPKPRLTF